MSSEEGNRTFPLEAGCGMCPGWTHGTHQAGLSRLDYFREALMGFCRIKTLHGLGGTRGHLQCQTEDVSEL